MSRRWRIGVGLMLSILVLWGAVGCGAGVDSAVPSPTPLPGRSDLTPSVTPTPSPSPSAPSPSRSGSPRPSPRPSPSVTPPGIPPSLLGTQWFRLPTSRRVVALTFDAGANADGVPAILSALSAANAPAVFFLTGRWVEDFPTYAAQIGQRYPVGNHTNTHPDLTTLTDARIRAQLSAACTAIRGATGRDPHPLFRFPFGAWDQHRIDVVNAAGYGAVAWTVDTRGWMGTSGGQSVDSVVQRVLDALQPGEIVIMHVGSNPDDGSTLDAAALPRVIREIRARGYTLVSLADFLGT